MQLIRLSVYNGDEQIRLMRFKDGVNIITNRGVSGNQIGKSTSLRALAFCLDGASHALWKDPDNDQINEAVKRFVTKGDVRFELELKIGGVTHIVSRMLSIKKAPSGRESVLSKNSINGVACNGNASFSRELPRIFGYTRAQPTFGTVRSKSFRTNRQTCNNSAKYLSPFTKDSEYALIYAYLFGFNGVDSVHHINVIDREIETEKERIKTLLGGQIENSYTQKLQEIDAELSELEVSEASYDILDSQDQLISQLRQSRQSVSILSSRVVNLETKLYYNQKTIQRYRDNIVDPDIEMISALYEEARAIIPDLTKSLEDTIQFHNSIMRRKAEYVEELSDESASELADLRESLERLLHREQSLVRDLARDSHFSGFILIEKQMQELREARGKVLYVIEQMQSSESRVRELGSAGDILKRKIALQYTDLSTKIDSFNSVFKELTAELFKNHDNELVVKSDKDGRAVFGIKNDELNTGDGVPRAAAMAFDMSYVSFSKIYRPKSLCFTAQDYLESVDEDKLKTLFVEANGRSIQTVVAILYDKISGVGAKFLKDNVILYLEEDEKFFKI
jgi:hypothetical protein